MGKLTDAIQEKKNYKYREGITSNFFLYLIRYHLHSTRLNFVIYYNTNTAEHL